MNDRISNPKIFLYLLFCSTLFSQHINFFGQLSSWGALNIDNPKSGLLGIHYLPTISSENILYKEFTFDFESSLHAYGAGMFDFKNNSELTNKLKFYRFWLRISSSRFNFRLGLQKINFGSAVLLRPLMWFDQVDPRDPLRLTDGLYGALFRYYFLNNTNIWVWGLLGNSKTKGWELISTNKKKPEVGGRIQIPFLEGEFAFTFHHRPLNPEGAFLDIYQPDTGSSSENRFAVDGKWNAEIGIWLEGVVIHQSSPSFYRPYQKLITMGADYTFGIGNGINIIGEHLIQQFSSDLLKNGESLNLSAVSVNYPIGLLDNITALFYQDWKHKDCYRFLSWQRTYDNVRIYLMGFWNPKQFQIYQSLSNQSLVAGKSFQIMIVLNH